MGRINEYNALFILQLLYLIYPFSFSFINVQNIEKKTIKLLNSNLKLFITRTDLALKNNRFTIN